MNIHSIKLKGEMILGPQAVSFLLTCVLISEVHYHRFNRTSSLIAVICFSSSGVITSRSLITGQSCLLILSSTHLTGAPSSPQPEREDSRSLGGA